MIAWQLQRTGEADYLGPSQQRFKPAFATETALIVLMGDLCQERDGGSTSVLALLDLLVAFDTKDHGTLLG